jgi:hypothetical protein
MPTSEKPTSEKHTSDRSAALRRIIKRTATSKNMHLQIRKHGTTLYHQEQAKRLSDDDDDA